jgi:transposase
VEHSESNTKVAGIDVAKHKLDTAALGQAPVTQFSNDPAAFPDLGTWLRVRGVTRVGLEATGGYEQAVASWLSQNGFEVVIHQPIEVRLFARLKRKRAKNDRIDAQIIAAATAQVDKVKAMADPVLRGLAERLTLYELAADQLAQLRGSLEHITQPDLRASHLAWIEQAKARKAALIEDVIQRIEAHPDLAERYSLLRSLPGCGPVVAASLVIRMPELGAMQHGQAPSLIGVAPFDRDTGLFKGQRHIAGGRSRPRRMLYLAALVASRFDKGFSAFAKRLRDAGKAPKVVIVAVMRKLIEAANLVLARRTPWLPTPTN